MTKKQKKTKQNKTKENKRAREEKNTYIYIYINYLLLFLLNFT